MQIIVSMKNDRTTTSSVQTAYQTKPGIFTREDVLRMALRTVEDYIRDGKHVTVWTEE